MGEPVVPTADGFADPAPDLVVIPGFAADLALSDIEVPWRQETLVIFGRPVKTPRLTCWIGDPGATYTYSGLANRPLPWTPVLTGLRARLEERLQAPFNSVLLNLYRDGRDSMGWHADDEPELGPEPLIASVSLGATRTFRLRHRTLGLPSVDLELEHGSLLVMRGTTQRDWHHCVPKRLRVDQPRLNLTFRYVQSGP